MSEIKFPEPRITYGIALDLLGAMEELRSGGYTISTPDHAIRMCQAVVANAYGFPDRTTWVRELEPTKELA